MIINWGVFSGYALMTFMILSCKVIYGMYKDLKKKDKIIELQNEIIKDLRNAKGI